jgi:hypothetical protein
MASAAALLLEHGDPIARKLMPGLPVFTITGIAVTAVPSSTV